MTTGGYRALDPFFDELRRRQPDIDIVVLPPDVTPPDAPPLGPSARRARADEVDRILDGLVRHTGLDDGRRTGGWRRTTGAAHRYAARTSWTDLTPQQSIGALRSLRDHLVDDPAWDARPGPGGGARLVAVDAAARFVVEAHAEPHSLVVGVRGAEVVLDDEQERSDG
ncbi:hypothetical protein [Nocardioides marmoraquaticus]